MAFIVLRIDATKLSVADCNLALDGGDATNPQTGVNALTNLLNAIVSGNVDASVEFATSPLTITIGGAGAGGVSGTFNLK